MYLNRVTLVGYLSIDAESRASREGNGYVILTLVTKRRWKDASSTWQSRSDYHRCTVWDRSAVRFASALKKGTHVQIEGELRSREYQKDGVAHQVVEIRVQSILSIQSACGHSGGHPQHRESGDDPDERD
ncbi:MAG: single-stranded DNA-binding protein [Bryobacteraceae bacterium]|nr:single-stranded DNA-binding protein [Bryobacteraceae bacterium]